ncbi:hypothetical protein HHS34_013525 [Acidithiobacillus montserratensis]|uniref:Uncharacterized protein n=1 Tax=Acidithiobacillus montserratensis TaxID=2729135 RepID=A0ACD5HGM1_9PROT|nr:hypothetical protein [Acidithiobacillus montserratensis]MBU2749068.1 hypothetical protein [Acidithiobacillus montserratensis]
MAWILANKDWIFGGIGISFFGLIIWFFHFNSRGGESDAAINNSTKVDVTVNNNTGDIVSKENQKSGAFNIDTAKSNTHILFVDDENFSVLKIIKKAGWIHTRKVKDIDNIDGNDATWADIYFIDIHGVGASMEFQEEGLGLAQALKRRYPKKGLVIYSSNQDGDMFNSALNLSDANLRKNTEPHEFLRTLENIAERMHNDK